MVEVRFYVDDKIYAELEELVTKKLKMPMNEFMTIALQMIIHILKTCDEKRDMMTCIENFIDLITK